MIECGLRRCFNCAIGRRATSFTPRRCRWVGGARLARCATGLASWRSAFPTRRWLNRASASSSIGRLPCGAPSRCTGDQYAVSLLAPEEARRRRPQRSSRRRPGTSCAHQPAPRPRPCPSPRFWNLASCITKMGAWSAWPLRAGGWTRAQTPRSTSRLSGRRKSSR